MAPSVSHTYTVLMHEGSLIVRVILISAFSPHHLWIKPNDSSYVFA